MTSPAIKRASALMLGAFLSFNLSAAPTIEIPHEKFTLDNGLRVIVHEDRKAPIVAVSVWYHVGSKDEPTGRTGFAHLFEHLMFNGSENYDDEYFKPFELVGATAMNGTTWFDRTNYFQNVPTPALDMALWMESDRMGHLLGAVTQEKLDVQRGVVQNEKRQGDNQPYGLVEYRVLEGLLPEGHPYRHSTIGSMEDLNAASLEDVHSWFKRYYGAANTVVVLAGDIDVGTARTLTEKYFGDIDAGPPLNKMQSWVPDRSHNTVEQMYDRVAQPRIYRYWAVPGRSTQEATLLNLAADVLGSGKNSRLYQALVYNNQLASNVAVNFQPHELLSFLYVDVTLKPGADAEKANALIDQEMARFMKDGPTEEELDRAATQFAAQTLRGFEAIGGFGGKATALAQGELYAGDPGFITQRSEWINAATPGDIQASANHWFNTGYYQLTVNPYPDYAVVETTADRSQLPTVSTMPELDFPTQERATLRNGMEVVLASRHSTPLVNMSLQFDAGYAADSTGHKLGTASFTMAMLDEGTRSKDALELSAEAERLGANINSGSNLDMSTVGLSALKENLEESIDLYADIIRNPAFSEAEIERLRGRWLANIEQEKSQPVQIALRMLPKMMYGEDHAYGIPLTGSGTTESIQSLEQDDLKSFHERWIRPDNGTLFVTGDTTMDELLPILNDAFGNWRASSEPVPAKNIAQVDLPEGRRVIIVDKPDSPQSLILGGHVAPPTGASDYLTTESMNEILGGAFTARVNMNLREDKSWAYGAYTFTMDARGQRPWLAYAPVQTDRTGDSISEILKEINEYQTTRPATAEELNKVVNTNVNSLPGQYETNNAVLGSMLSNQRFGRPDDYVTTLKAQYEALNLESIQANAEEVIHPEKITWLIVGDAAKIQSQLEAIGMDNIVFMNADGEVLK